MSGCVTSHSSASPASSPTASAAPPAAGQAAVNSAFQVVGTGAADNGLTGNGGTVTGDTPQAVPPEWAQLSVERSPLMGSRLVDVNGSALYRFDEDTTRPTVPHCAAECATRWPPVTIMDGARVFLSGIDPKQVGAIRRQDGLVQVTVGGRPVYRFSGDNLPGDTNGQGAGGKWFLVGPTGEKAAR